MAQQQQLGDRHNQQQQLGDRHKQHQRHALAHASTHASTHACSHAHRTHLNDLPDSCLLHVFKHLFPAPDKFSVAATCWRFYRLVSDRRLWLKVSPTGVVPESAPGGAGPVYTTLQAAVQASRPGDTIWLAPGVTHSAADVHIPWPLHLLGGGQQPSDTWLSAPAGSDSDCALVFTASAKVAQLSVASTLCPCIIHKRGSLTLQDCVLTAEPRGLYHLVSPVLTLAVSVSGGSVAGAGGSSGADGGGSSNDAGGVTAVATADAAGVEAASGGVAAAAAAAAAATTTTAAPNNSALMLHCKPPRGIGPGKLQVIECQLMGGSTAVRCGGTGQLRNVRAIYETHSKAPYLWLEVDSACGPSRAAAAAAAAAGVVIGVGSGAGVAAGPGLLGETGAAGGEELWVAAGTLLQQQPAAAKDTGHGDADMQQQQQLLLQERSKAWQQQRRCGQQHLQQQQFEHMSASAPAAALVELSASPGCPNVGLARIQAVLGGRSINPASLAAHLSARHQQHQQRQQEPQ